MGDFLNIVAGVLDATSHHHHGGHSGHHHHHSHHNDVFNHNQHHGGYYEPHRYHHHHYYDPLSLWATTPTPIYYDRRETQYYNSPANTANYYRSDYAQKTEYQYVQTPQIPKSNPAPVATYAAKYQPVKVNPPRAPKSTSHVALGINAYNSGNLRSAKNHFNAVLEKANKRNKHSAQQQQNKSTAQRYLGKIALAEGNIDKAKKCFTDLPAFHKELTQQMLDALKPIPDDISLELIEDYLQDVNEAIIFVNVAMPLFVETPETSADLREKLDCLDGMREDLLLREAKALMQLNDPIEARLKKSSQQFGGWLFGYKSKYKRVFDAAQELQRQIYQVDDSNLKASQLDTTPLLSALKSKRTNLNPFREADSWKAVPLAVRRTFR